jgi:hypothetical protein
MIVAGLCRFAIVLCHGFVSFTSLNFSFGDEELFLCRTIICFMVAGFFAGLGKVIK